MGIWLWWTAWPSQVSGTAACCLPITTMLPADCIACASGESIRRLQASAIRQQAAGVAQPHQCDTCRCWTRVLCCCQRWQHGKCTRCLCASACTAAHILPGCVALQLWTWGKNKHGQLGLGSGDLTPVPTTASLPSEAPADATVTATGCGDSHLVRPLWLYLLWTCIM